ncbi:MAG: hypothetical protein JOZ75_10950 [Candidatus Dormibacteraeota bacterium]|nr:hypothetical protein [Candidatus Dormibacteraeota bacterium]
MAFVGDAANFVLGGIPGDIHDILNPDVDPGDLQRASIAMTQFGDSVAAVHLHLNDSVATIKGRWEGSGATAFQTDIWQPLSDGLDVLERESHNAAHQLANLGGQAAEAHMQKIMAIEQEVQTQLNFTVVTWELTPAAGKALAELLSGVASRLGADIVSEMVFGVARAIDALTQHVLTAFAQLLEWLARPFATFSTDVAATIGRVPGVSAVLDRPGSDAGLTTDTDSTNLASPERANHILNGDAKGGGHLWPGMPGKSPFPADWSSDKIMNAASDIATGPECDRDLKRWAANDHRGRARWRAHSSRYRRERHYHRLSHEHPEESMSERPKPESYAALDERLSALLPALKDAVPVENWRWFEEWIRAGEYGLAVEVAAEGLTGASAIPPELCRGLLAAADAMQLNSDPIVDLRTACTRR